MLNILVADDSTISRLLLIEFFKKDDEINIHQAKDGREAIFICKKNNIDIVFMDIEMPNIDGIQATKRIKLINPKIVVIAVTSYNRNKHKRAMFNAGVEDYVVKPVSKKLFLYKLESFKNLAKYRVINSGSSIDKSSDIKTVFNLKNTTSMGLIWNFIVIRNRDLFDFDFMQNIIRCVFEIVGNFAKKNDSLSIILIYKGDEKVINFVLKGIKLNNKILSKVKEIVNYEFSEGELPEILSKIDVKYTEEHISFKIKAENFIDKEEIKDEYIEDDDWFDLDSNDEFIDLDSEADIDRYELLDYFNSTHSKITAVEFLDKYHTNANDFKLMMNDLEDIKESMEIHIERLYEDNLGGEVHFLIKTFRELSLFLNVFGEFEELATVLNILATLLDDTDFDDEFQGNKTKHFIAEYIKAILEDILEWESHVFVEKDAVDIFYINASIYNSYLQLNDTIKKL